VKALDKLIGVEKGSIVEDITGVLDVHVFKYDRRAYENKTIEQQFCLLLTISYRQVSLSNNGTYCGAHDREHEL
jgi:hypothetical protein